MAIRLSATSETAAVTAAAAEEKQRRGKEESASRQCAHHVRRCLSSLGGHGFVLLSVCTRIGGRTRSLLQLLSIMTHGLGLRLKINNRQRRQQIADRQTDRQTAAAAAADSKDYQDFF